MRKGRLICWIISLVICAVIIFFIKKEESRIPYEEKTQLNVYCTKEFQEETKEMLTLLFESLVTKIMEERNED